MTLLCSVLKWLESSSILPMERVDSLKEDNNSDLPDWLLSYDPAETIRSKLSGIYIRF